MKITFDFDASTLAARAENGDETPCAVFFQDAATVLALVARARRADELSKRVAELEARVEYLS